MDDLHGSCYEPMEVDLSARSNSPMEISFNDLNDDAKVKSEPSFYESHYLDQEFETSLTRRPVAHVENGRQSPSASDSTISTPRVPTTIKKVRLIRKKDYIKTFKFRFKVLFGIFVIVLIGLYQMFTIQCSNELNIETLKGTLSEYLLGQNKAIDLFIDALNATERSKLILIYGGTGVGKTFTTMMLLNELGYKSNVYHYKMTSLTELSTELMVGLAMCKHTFVIVDDLKLDHNIHRYIENLVVETQDLRKNLTVILVYSCIDRNGKNICDTEFSMKLLKPFEKIDTLKKVIEFQTLQEEDLQGCIEQELTRKISEEEFLEFKRHFDVVTDGCKGVHRRIQQLAVIN